MRSAKRAGVAIGVSIWFCMAVLFAGEGGTVSGTLADPTGAVISDVIVEAHNAATAVVQRTVSNQAGFYAFPALPAGRYSMEVAHPGFAAYRKSGIEVGATASVRVDVILLLGERSETVLVTEAVTQVDTTDTQLGERIGTEKLTGIPVNGRSYTDMLALQPGVIPATSAQPNAVVMSGCTNAPPSGDLNPGNMSVSGQRETTNGFRVNGNSAQEGFNMGAAVIPNLDSIQEFRVLTSNFDAEHGNFSGGQVLVTTKSGANEIHGTVFEFLRNTNLDARNFLAHERARYDRHQYGGTVGGPIRKDRVFFFADYQGTRMTQGLETGRISVPSAANRAGDFSDRAGLLSGTVNGPYWASLLSNRFGYTVRPGERYYFPGCGDPADCVLPNARVPERAWSKPAASLLQYVPKANQANDVFSTSAYNQTLRDDKGAMKIDFATGWGALSGYYFSDDYTLDNPYPTGQGGANVPGFNAISTGRAQLATIGLTTTFGPSAINELRAGYLRNSNNIGQPVGGVGPSLASQGFVHPDGRPGIVALAPDIEGIENVSFNDFTIGVDITGVQQANNTYQISDNFSKVSGRHMLKFGASTHIDHVNIGPNAMYNGSFLFQGTETGVDFADFLLGIPSSYAQGDSKHFYLRNRYAGAFAQDSWQIHPNLTFNFGLRWDLLPPWREKFNQLQTLVLGQQSVVYPGAPRGLVFPGDPGIPDTLSPPQYANFAPRLGIAYSPWDKTSIRAGYGIFYTAIEGLSAGIMSACPPYGYDYDSFAPPLFETPFITAASGQDIGQRFPSPIPSHGASAAYPNSNVDWSQYLPVTGVPSFFHRNVTPYSGSYTFTIQRELPGSLLLSAGYVGTQAHHLLVLTSANPGNRDLCLTLSDPANVAPGTATCGPFGESGTYITRAGQTIQGTRGPFSSQFAAVTLQKTIGNSNYNAFELSVRRSGRWLDFLAGYTYSKSLDQSSSLAEAVNPIDANLSKALSAFDMRHNFVTSYRATLPFDKLRRSRWTEGWSLSGVARLGTGMPVTLFNDNDTSLLGTIPNGINNNGVDTPDVRAGDLRVNHDARNGQPAFNTSLFSLPSLGSIGTAARRFFHGPGIRNFDMALGKELRLAERRRVEMRLEAFNVFNHAQFFGAAAVNGNITSASFGQIVAAAPPRKIQIALKYAF